MNFIKRYKMQLAGSVLSIFLLGFFVMPTPARAQTVAELQAMIEALIQQINFLIAQQNGSESTEPVTCALTRDLTVGDNGADVKILENFLNRSGYVVSVFGSGAPIADTSFNTNTRDALARYQAVSGITPAVGYFGPKTRANINPRLTPADCGNEDNDVSIDVDLVSTRTTIVDSNTGSFEIIYQVAARGGDVYVSHNSSISELNPSVYYHLNVPFHTTTGDITVFDIEGGDNQKTLIKEGESKNFRLRVTASPVNSGNIRLHIGSISWGADGQLNNRYNNLSHLRTPYLSLQGREEDGPEEVSIEVMSPNGGEAYESHTGVPFSWRWSESTRPSNPVAYIVGATNTDHHYYGKILEYNSRTSVQRDELFNGVCSESEPCVPGLQIGREYLVKVCEFPPNNNTGDPQCDVSDSPFVIAESGETPMEVTVVTPNGGEEWEEGSVQTIRWESEGLPSNAKIYISLFRADGANTQIVSNLPATAESYRWTVSTDGRWGLGSRSLLQKIVSNLGISVANAAAPAYKIQVSVNDGSGVDRRYSSDQSNSYFYIVPGQPQLEEPEIIISSPRNNATYTPGNTMNIVYTLRDFPRPVNVEIQLNKNATYPHGPYNPVQTITRDVSGTGRFEWTVPSGLTSGDDYSIFISTDYPSTETGYRDWSDEFTISTPVTSLSDVRISNFTNEWVNRTPKTITWNYDNVPNDQNMKFRVGLYTHLNGGMWGNSTRVSVNSISGTGSVTLDPRIGEPYFNKDYFIMVRLYNADGSEYRPEGRRIEEMGSQVFQVIPPELGSNTTTINDEQLANVYVNLKNLLESLLNKIR